jgi:hypothetical protein
MRDHARDVLAELHLEAVRLSAALRDAGASIPIPSTNVDQVPLRFLDTPANRRLLGALTEAYGVAQDVAQERADCDPHGPVPGTVAFEIMVLLARVELEVHGPVGEDE